MLGETQILILSHPRNAQYNMRARKKQFLIGKANIQEEWLHG